ncbi:hypothetical protein HOLleu_40561 [Holothuria leucospilota]|uniref:Uncharacterized protein n=1 Tax=Holothuria leucospilota TaxID=206669 RepID=A0A9Q0YDJ2_HOLLE|nr:hypothetical protein HOLleu_40561 [Holothuria leucospilota]
MLRDLGWDSLKDRRTVNRLVALHKDRLGLLALPIANLSQPVWQPSRHQHLNSFSIIHANKDCFKYRAQPKFEP